MRGWPRRSADAELRFERSSGFAPGGLPFNDGLPVNSSGPAAQRIYYHVRRSRIQATASNVSVTSRRISASA